MSATHLYRLGVSFHSHNNCYGMRADSSALTLRLVWQSSPMNSAILLTIRPCSVLTEPPESALVREQWQTLDQSLPLESAGKPEQTEYQARFACGSFPERSACDRYGHKASHSSTVASSASVKVKSYLSLTSSCCVA